jgi:hypothetical protein
MKTYKHNGEAWFADERSLFKRVRHWIIWVGGLEKVNQAGWTLESARLSWRAFHDLPIHRRFLDCLTPISLFGHRATLQWFGLDIRVWGAYLCIHWRETKYGPARLRIYRSRNATPSAAHLWIRGVPSDVITDAEAHQRAIVERDTQWQANLTERRKWAEMARRAELN